MKRQPVTLTRADVQGIEQIAQAVLECAHLDEAGVGIRYALVGELLLNNVRRLELDEDIEHLFGFARSIACELLSPSVRAIHFRGSCWEPGAWDKFPPFYRKIGGRNAPSSDVRPVEKQKIGMAGLLAQHLKKDPGFAPGAHALLEYEETHGLWTPEDFVDRQ
jgi:hypothetical protein